MSETTTNPASPVDRVGPAVLNAITGFANFDPARGTARAWLFGIARNVFAKHCDAYGARAGRDRCGWRGGGRYRMTR